MVVDDEWVVSVGRNQLRRVARALELDVISARNDGQVASFRVCLVLPARLPQQAPRALAIVTRRLRCYPSLSDLCSAACPVCDESSVRRTLGRAGQSTLVWPFQSRRLLCVDTES
jgi:hypothetical protein